MSTNNNKLPNDDKLLEQSLALKTASKQLLEQQLLSVVPNDDGDVDEQMPEHGKALAEARNEANYFKNEYVGAFLANQKQRAHLKKMPQLPSVVDVFDDEQKHLLAIANSMKEVARLMGTVSQYLKMIHHIFRHARSCTADECEYEQACWRMQGLWWHTVKLEKRGRLDAGALTSLWNKQLDYEMHMDYCTVPLCECTDIEHYHYYFMKRINDVRTGQIRILPGAHPFANLLRHFKAKVDLALQKGKPDPECRSTAYLYYKLASMDIGPHGKENAKTSWAEWTATVQCKQQPAAAAAAPAASAPAKQPAAAAPAAPQRLADSVESVEPSEDTDGAARCRPIVAKNKTVAAGALAAAETPAPAPCGGAALRAPPPHMEDCPKATPAEPVKRNPCPVVTFSGFKSLKEDNAIPPNCKRIDAIVGGGQRVQLIEFPDKKLKRKDDPNGPYVTLDQLREEYKRGVKEKAEREYAEYLASKEAKKRAKRTAGRSQPGIPCMTDEDRQRIAREEKAASQQKPQTPCDHAVEKKCNCTFGEKVVEPSFENIEEFDKELRGAPPTKPEMDELRKRLSEIVSIRGVEADVKNGDKKSVVRVVTCAINGVRFRVAFQGDIHNHFNRDRYNDTVAKYIFAGTFLRDVRVLFYNFAPDWGSEGDKRMLALLKPVSKLALPYNLNYVSPVQSDELQVKFLLAREQVMKRAVVINAVEKAEKSKEKKAQLRRERESLWFSGTHVLVAGKDLKQNWKMRLEEDIAYFGNLLFYLCTLGLNNHQRTRVLMHELECLRVYAALARFDQVNENGTASEEIQKGRRYQQAVETKPLRTVKAQVNWVLSQKSYDISPEEDSERFVIEQMSKILDIGNGTDGGATMEAFMVGLRAMSEAGIVCGQEDFDKILGSHEAQVFAATGKWPMDEQGCYRPPPHLFRMCQEAADKGVLVTSAAQAAAEAATTSTAQPQAPMPQQQQPTASVAANVPQSEQEAQKRHAENVAKVRQMVGPCSNEDAELAALGLDKMNQMIAEAQKMVSSSSSLSLSKEELDRIEKMMHEARHRNGGPTPPKRAANEQTKPAVEASKASPAPAPSSEKTKIDEFTLDFDRILKVGEVVDESVRASSHLLDMFPLADVNAFMDTIDPIIAMRWASMRKKRRGEQGDINKDTMKKILTELNLLRDERKGKKNGNGAAPLKAFSSEEEERQHCSDEAYIAGFMDKAYAVTKVSLGDEQDPKQKLREQLRHQWEQQCTADGSLNASALPVDDETFEELWQFMVPEDGKSSEEQFKIFPRRKEGAGDHEVVDPPAPRRQTIRQLENEILNMMVESDIISENEATKGSENGAGTDEDDSDLDVETKKYDEYFRQKVRVAREKQKTANGRQMHDEKEQERLSKLTTEERAFENRQRQIVDYKGNIETLRIVEIETLLQCAIERETNWTNEAYEPVKEEALEDYEKKLKKTRGSLFQTKMNLKSALRANGRSEEAEEIDKKGEHEVRASCIVADWCDKLDAMEKDCERKITQAQKLTRKERMKVQAKVEPELKRIKDEQEIMMKMKYDAAFWYEDKVASLRTRPYFGKAPEDEDDSDLYSSDDGPYVSAESTAEEEEEEGPNKGRQGIRSQPLPPIDDPSNCSDWSVDEDEDEVEKEDPNKPRKPMCAMVFWMGENDDNLRKHGMSTAEYCRVANREWLKVRDKSKWETLAMRDKARYERDMAAYKGQ